MRPSGSAQWLEQRRRRALALLGEGRSLQEVARLIPCAASSVLRWREGWQREGEKALAARSSPGRPCKLAAAQRRQLVDLLQQGPSAHGYPGPMWTTASIAELIERSFGVSYHRDHVGRLMRRLGWRYQEFPTEPTARPDGLPHGRPEAAQFDTTPGWAPQETTPGVLG
jgi:transposase